MCVVIDVGWGVFYRVERTFGGARRGGLRKEVVL